jgi:hypothetical protein
MDLDVGGEWKLEVGEKICDLLLGGEELSVSKIRAADVTKASGEGRKPDGLRYWLARLRNNFRYCNPHACFKTGYENRENALKCPSDSMSLARGRIDRSRQVC